MQGTLSVFIKKHFLLLLTLCIALLVYSRLFNFHHISWDDPEMVFKNKAVREFNLPALFSNQYVGNYLPVTMLFHALAWFLFENNDWGHHLLNILFHLVNGILVYQLGKKLFKTDLITNLGAIIFLLHPLQVESVAWISELKNILSTTFFLLALLQYLNYYETGKTKTYFLSLLLFVLACLSKPSAVILPLVLIATDVFLTGGFSLKNILNKIPFLLLSLLFGIIAIKTQAAGLFINHSHEFAWYQRTGLAGFALLNYLLLFIAPHNLSVIYPYPAVKIATVILGLFALLALLASLVLLWRKQKKQTVFLILFILINLILVLQFLPFGEVLYADRYQYVPIIGFAFLAASGIHRLKLPNMVTGLVLIALFATLTYSRTGTWKSALNLYEDIIKKYPGQFVALNSAGVECMFLNNDAKALDYFNEATRVAPNNYKGFYNRGLLFIKNNKPQQAIASFNQALNLYQYPKAYTGRATAYYMLGDLPKAMNDANYTLNSDKDNIKAHFVLGNCYSELNKLDDALKEYNKCIELNTDEADYYFKRAIVYGKKQEFQSGLNDLELSLSLNPGLTEAWYWKGVTKVNLKQNPCEDFRVAAQKNYEPAVQAYNRYCK